MKPLSKNFSRVAGLALLNTALLFSTSTFLTSCTPPTGPDTGTGTDQPTPTPVEEVYTLGKVVGENTPGVIAPDDVRVVTMRGADFSLDYSHDMTLYVFSDATKFKEGATYNFTAPNTSSYISIKHGFNHSAKFNIKNAGITFPLGTGAGKTIDITIDVPCKTTVNANGTMVPALPVAPFEYGQIPVVDLNGAGTATTFNINAPLGSGVRYRTGLTAM